MREVRRKVDEAFRAALEKEILDDEGNVIGRVGEQPWVASEDCDAFIPPTGRIGYRGQEHVNFRYDEVGDEGFTTFTSTSNVSRETFPRDWRDHLANWWLARPHALRSGWVIGPLSVKLPGENPVKPAREMPVHHFLWWWFDGLAWNWLLKRGGTKAFDPPEVRIR